MKNNKIFITGGAGFLGKALIRRLYKDNEIVVYSRDESKHYFLKKQFPKIRTIVGDVRNFDLMKRAAKGANVGIYAASLKQIEACDTNVEEAIQSIVYGAINGRRISEELNMTYGCFISSDKSRAPTTIYGALKFVGGESFILNPSTNTKLNSIIYGNVLNSTGSIIPLIWESIKNNRVLSLYHKDMTRFSIDIDSAVDLILKSENYNGFSIVPNLKSFKVKDLFEIYTKFGLKYEETAPRVGEKIHEIMICEEELPRTHYDEKANIFIIHPKSLRKADVKLHINKEFSSKDNLITVEELDTLLASFNYFQ